MKAIIEEEYEKQIMQYRYANPPLSRRTARQLEEWKSRVKEIMGLD